MREGRVRQGAGTGSERWMMPGIIVLLGGILGFLFLHAADAGTDFFLQMLGMASARPPVEADAGSAPAMAADSDPAEDAVAAQGGEAFAGVAGTAPAQNGAGQSAPAWSGVGVRTADVQPLPGMQTAEDGSAVQAEPQGVPLLPDAASASPRNREATSPAGRVALTFDDGPDGKYTPMVLDILAEYGVTATFFVVGVQAERYPEVLARIRDEGHEIGSHGYAHARMDKMTAAEAAEDLRLADEAIREAADCVPMLFRPPYGAVSDELKAALAESGKTLVRWNVDPRDWDGTEAGAIASHVLENAKDGAIILLHSFGGKHSDLGGTIEALPMIIEGLLSQGYELTTVSGLEREDG